MAKEKEKTIENRPQWEGYRDIHILALPKDEGVKFLGHIAGCIDSPFQKLVEGIAPEISGDTAFFLIGEKVECRLPITGSEKYKPYNQLYFYFFDRTKQPVNWTDQGQITLVFINRIDSFKSSPLLSVSWDFLGKTVSVAREVKHNKAFATPSHLKIELPMDYADTPDIMPGIKVSDGSLEIGYPFTLEPDAPKIVVPLCILAQNHLLPLIHEDMKNRGFKKEI